MAKLKKIKLNVPVLGTRQSELHIKEVDNPSYSRDHDGQPWNVRRIRVAVNIRESPISALAARGGLDEAQIMAAGRFRQVWESAGGTGASAMDYSREPVDGGGFPNMLSDRQIDAVTELVRCQGLTGVVAHGVMSKVIGEGYSVKDISKTTTEQIVQMGYLKDGLTVLAEYWGYKTRKYTVNIRGSHT